MTKLFVQNKKIKKATTKSNGKLRVFNFGIPAYESATGFKTCPMAGSCAKEGGCYAQQGAYTWSNVAQAYEKRLLVTRLPFEEFKDRVVKELDILLKTANRLNSEVVIRIHDSGDFYSLDYINNWIKIMRMYPDIKFYAYTKMVPLFNKINKLPVNFRVIYSEGGLADKKIDRGMDFHARVFQNKDDLETAGYQDASDDDMVAALGSNKKIGLIYHGAKSKSWNTDK